MVTAILFAETSETMTRSALLTVIKINVFIKGKTSASIKWFRNTREIISLKTSAWNINHKPLIRPAITHNRYVAGDARILRIRAGCKFICSHLHFRNLILIEKRSGWVMIIGLQ